jgi:glycosyltransferase involved in cell wall biosynthesis
MYNTGTTPSNPRHTDDAPAVSIIIPAFNSASYIGEALDSVFAQTFSDYETIVINDGSPDTDKLEQVLEPYKERIIYLKQENRGPGGARNTAILKARGEYVALLDSDDVWLPNYLAQQMHALRKNPALDLIYSDALLVGDSPLAGRNFMEDNPSSGEASFESLLRWDCTVITSCTVARRQSLIDAGLFDECFYYSEDFDLWLRLAHRGGLFDYQKQVLANHRLHPSSLCADGVRQLEGEIKVYEKWMQEPSLSLPMRRLIRAQMEYRRAELGVAEGKRKLLAGQYAQARESFARANDFFHQRKLRLTLVGLRFAPYLFKLLYNLRETGFALKYRARHTV